jgi:HlyD family secretion protein
LNAKYPGSSVQPDEIICSVSPEGPLVGECYVSSRDMGLLKKSQPARFQIDAFNYNYFGVLKGCIISLDNDFTLVDNKPAFKIICRFDENKLKLKNGYRGEIKKGLTFRARFICGTRSLWQLLYDTMDDWFNPVAAADPLQ